MTAPLAYTIMAMLTLIFAQGQLRDGNQGFALLFSLLAVAWAIAALLA